MRDAEFILQLSKLFIDKVNEICEDPDTSSTQKIAVIEELTGILNLITKAETHARAVASDSISAATSFFVRNYFDRELASSILALVHEYRGLQS